MEEPTNIGSVKCLFRTMSVDLNHTFTPDASWGENGAAQTFTRSGYVATRDPKRLTMMLADGTRVDGYAHIGDRKPMVDENGEPTTGVEGRFIGTPLMTFPRRVWRRMTFRERRKAVAVRRWWMRPLPPPPAKDGEHE